MDIDVFAGIAVGDFEAALAWYERLLGAPATFEPHATESVWTLTEHGHVYVVLRPELAGRSLVTLFVDDLDGFVASAADRGLRPESSEVYDNGVRKTVYRDPDGNEIGVGGGGS